MDDLAQWAKPELVAEIVRLRAALAADRNGSVAHGAELLGTMSVNLPVESAFLRMADGIDQLAWIAKPDGFIYWYNRRWYEYTGTTPEAMEGWGWQSVHDPDALPSVVERWKAAIAAGERFDMEFPLRGSDGVFRHFLTRAMPMKDDAGNVLHWFGTNTQIDDLRKAESALAEAHRRTLTALNSMSDCYVELDEEFRLTFMNDAAVRLTELEAAHVRGKTHWEVWPDTNGTVIEREYRRAMRDRTEAHFEFFSDLLSVWLEIDAFPTARGLAIYFRDVTQEKRAVEEREQLLNAERAARSEAERQSRIKDEFLATLSHELRTPLNAILGWSQILARDTQLKPNDLRDGLTVIERNARMQAQIIEDLLDMSRIVSGVVRLEIQRVDLISIIDAAIDVVQPAADAKEIRIERILDPLAAAVRGDSARLQQVLWNLLNNAVKFTPKGGKVQVLLERVNSHVEISVSDNGQGMKPEFLPHAFDKFRQADASTTRRSGGLGLGLAIVKQLIELHGGQVRAKSPGEGQGSTFVVHLPVPIVGHLPEEGRQHPTAPRHSNEASLDDCQPELAGVSVLVVDDEPDGLELAKRILINCGATVRAAGTVDAAEKLFDAHHFHVLVSDIGMPVRDGFDLIRAVRERTVDRGGMVPAVALTAFARSEDRRRVMTAGFDMHVAKPVEPSELVAVVARLSQRRR